MSNQCKHNGKLRKDGLCSECAAIKPYTVFRFDPECNKSGPEDKCCGYFWGPGQSVSLSGNKV